MQVKLLEAIKHQGRDFGVNDVTTVDDSTGAYFCGNGWAEDMDGKVKTAARDVNKSAKLNVDSAKANTKSGKV